MAARFTAEKKWTLAPVGETERETVAALVEELGVSATMAKLLCRRGFQTPAAARRFLSSADAVLHSPFLLLDMDKAVDRVLTAVARGEKIAVYGDYDVDGVTSVALLYLYLGSLGADVCYYIPSRTGEGYGLSVGALDKLAAEDVQCIVTVDTGVTANEEAQYAASLGIDLVITDHHECRLPLPEAVAVVNPHRPDCSYPFKELAGVGVAFKLACAIEATRAMARGEREVDAVREIALRYADLVAVGTVADVMPIAEENRVIVRLGIAEMTKSPRLGLEMLMEEAAGERGRRKKITAGYLGFVLAPRLNAAGRMRDARLAVELLLAKTEGEARELARLLCEINHERQVEENSIAEEAYRQIEENFDLARTHILVLAGSAWRQGIIGIVASRVTERYGLPSILISFEGSEGEPSGQDLGRGSGRSVKGVNLVEALTGAEDLLVKFGGHELAAGLTVRRADIPALRERLNEFVGKSLDGVEPASVHADMELQLAEASLALVEELSLLEPFGVANPTVRFVFRDLRIDRITEMGGGKHLRLTVARDGVSLNALLFSTSRTEFPFTEGERIDLLGTLDINEFRDTRSVQIMCEDCKASQLAGEELSLEKARYVAVEAGERFALAEGILPDHPVLSHIYLVLRREFRRGNAVLGLSELLSLVNVGAPRHIPYACLKFALKIFSEMRLCGVEEMAEDTYAFDVYFVAAKINIEKSSLLKRLRAQCCDRV